MMANPISDIRAIVGVSPQTLKISSVRTKKICVQDILSGMKEKPTYYIPVYEPPKLIDLLKSSMVAVINQDLNKEIKESEKEAEKERKLSEIEEALKNRALQTAPSTVPPQSVFLPPEVNVPIVTYTPYTGGQQQAPSANPISNLPDWLKEILQRFQQQQGAPTQPSHSSWQSGMTGEMGHYTSQLSPEKVLGSMQYMTSNFMGLLNRASSEINKYLMEIKDRVELNRKVMVRENRYMVDAVSMFTKAMSKSLADYIRNMVVSIIENGCSYLPVGLAGVLDVRVINNSPLPQAIVFDNVVVKSMDYTISKPRPFTVFAAPAETDIVHIPITVENVDAVDYILDAKKKGAIPIVLSATVGVGPMKQSLTFAEGSVEVV